MQPRIEIRHLTKAFGSKVVLNKLDLDVFQGESLVVIGGSGSGKSVLIKCIMGLIEPDAGSIKIDGIELIGASQKVRAEVMAKISMMFQGSALFDSLPVWENVVFLLLQQGKCTRKEGRQIAIEALTKVGLGSIVADLSPSELSGGMQRRVALARAVITKPEIILFDEPTAGLDPIFSSVINGIIVDSVKELGATAITITHDMASACQIGDRVVMLYEGKIIWNGAADSIETADNPYVQQFIHGCPIGPINLSVK